MGGSIVDEVESIRSSWTCFRWNTKYNDPVELYENRIGAYSVTSAIEEIRVEIVKMRNLYDKLSELRSSTRLKFKMYKIDFSNNIVI